MPARRPCLAGWPDPRPKPPRKKGRRKAPRKGPTADTVAALKEIEDELAKARRHGLRDLDPARFPVLAALQATAEHAATHRKGRTFHFRGSRYTWAESMLGRVSVWHLDGRPIVSGEPLDLLVGG